MELLMPQRFDYPPGFTLMKRIVGEGGDVVCLKREGLYINGKISDLIPTQNIEGMFKQIDQDNLLETPEKLIRRFGFYGVTIPYRVPESHYFVLGDNVFNSIDSRLLDAIPRENIIRKFTKIYWPPSRIRLLYGKDSADTE